MKIGMKAIMTRVCFICIICMVGSLLLVSKASAGGSKTYKDFKYSMTGNTIRISSYKGNAEKVVFPDKINGIKVTEIDIDRDGIHNLRNTKEITIGQYINWLPGGNAPFFTECKNLSKITVRSKNKSFYSEDGVLFWKWKDEIYLAQYPAKKQTKNGSYSIPEGVSSIGYGAFNHCSKLKQIYIPKSLKSAADYFNGCTGLKSIKVSSKNKYYASKMGSLYNKKLTTLYRCPNKLSSSYRFPKTVTSVGSAAFKNNTQLKNIIVPSWVKKIGTVSFEYCKNLGTVRIKGKVKKIYTSDFLGCNLKKMILENPLTDLYVHKGAANDEDAEGECLHIAGGCAREIFRQGGKATIYCKKGSKASKTAMKYNLQMKYIS